MGNKQNYHLNMQAREQQRSYNLSTLIWLDLKGLLCLRRVNIISSLLMISQCAGFTFSNLNHKLQVFFGDLSNRSKSKVGA